MDLRKLKTLIELVESSGIGELEIQEGEERVRITRAVAGAVSAAPTVYAAAAPVAAATPVPVEAPAAAAEPEGHLVKSPMVGTFYRGSQPGAPPLVEEGDPVVPGQTLFILEAMKLMNEVKAEIEGVVRAIHVQNGQPVEFGQALFDLEPALVPPLDAL